MRRLMSAALAILLLLSMLPASAFAGETDSKAARYEGKKAAVLGDSISTFIGISNNGADNSTLANGAVFYRPGTNGVDAADTWWQQLVDALGMELLVNNSWSGSAMFRPRAGTPGAYVDRCVQLHNDHTGEDPDVIWIYLGTNDYSDYLGGAIDWGTAEGVSAGLITDNGDGSYVYAQPATFLEAYAIALHKMHLRYPEAEIYCLGMLRRSAVSQKLTDSNTELKKLVESLGYPYVDLESCIGPTIEDFRQSNGYDELHPAPEGMDRITRKVLSAMLDRDANPVGPEPGEDLVGDADGSGEVDYLDAMLILQYHTGVVGDDALCLSCCDVDGSGEVDYLDAMLVLQYHTGVIAQF